MFDRRFVRVYVIPGAVFQSVMIGGGYGTGREIVEYFTAFGPLGGFLGIAAAYAALAVVLAVTFEFSRCFAAYDYRSFFRKLLGRGWFAFEALILLQFLLILAVLASAAGNILEDRFSIRYEVGLLIMLFAIGTLTFYGRQLIAKVLTFWSLFLYVVVLVFFVTVFDGQWSNLIHAVAHSEVLPGSLWSGFKYAFYNLSTAPLLLYVARSFETRAQTLRSGALAGAIAMIPAVIFQLAFASQYPAVLDQAIPVYWMMLEAGAPVLLVVYSAMLFGTFIETGAGMLQGINDRIDSYYAEVRGRELSRLSHSAIAIVAVLLSAVLSFWGIINLIARGYGTMAWGFLFVYVLPLLTVGIYKIRTR